MDISEATAALHHFVNPTNIISSYITASSQKLYTNNGCMSFAIH